MPTPTFDRPVADPRARVEELLLVDVVTRLADRVDLWTPLVCAEPDSQVEPTWRRLSVSEGVEVYVVTWPTFTGTHLHRHDESPTAFVTLCGVVTEIRPDARERLLPRKISPGMTHLLGPGEVHDLQNEHATTAVSIHAFLPGRSGSTPVEWRSGAYVPAA